MSGCKIRADTSSFRIFLLEDTQCLDCSTPPSSKANGDVRSKQSGRCGTHLQVSAYYYYCFENKASTSLPFPSNILVFPVSTPSTSYSDKNTWSVRSRSLLGYFPEILTWCLCQANDFPSTVDLIGPPIACVCPNTRTFINYFVTARYMKIHVIQLFPLCFWIYRNDGD